MEFEQMTMMRANLTADGALSLQFNWQYFVARSGEAGSSWMVEFAREEYRELAAGMERALGLARRRQPELARQILELISQHLVTISEVRPSIAAVLGRLYHGCMAYYLYKIDELDAAQRELDAAARCVADAVNADRVLVPLAHDCHEFHLHHARIARSRRSWADMRKHIDIVRGMVECRAPLCVLADGTIIDYDALRRHYEGLPLGNSELEALRSSMELEHRRRHFEGFIVQLYQLPGFVIPYV